MTNNEAANMTTAELEAWVANHRACVAAGINVGMIRERKAQAFELELIHRSL